MPNPQLIDTLFSQTHNGFHATLRRGEAIEWLETILGTLFPPLADHPHLSREGFAVQMNSVENVGVRLLQFLSVPEPHKVIEELFNFFPEFVRMATLSSQAIFEGDPAARFTEEVILAYPGFYATTVHRISNFLYMKKVPTLPRLLSEFSHERTGIDIHPGATIGQEFCIDHGTGIVIGETSIIGNRVKMYQGVTLGALSVQKHFADKKRHPTVEDDVVIYANATVLGGNTVIGSGSVIGGNVWLTESVPANSKVYCKVDVDLKSPS